MNPIAYRVHVQDVHAHLFSITLSIANPGADQLVSLPVWIPGSYLVREFSKNLQGLQARQGRSKTAITQLDKCTWQVHCTPGKPLVLSYQVYALDSSVRTAWLSAERGFFNGTSLCLRVHGHEDSPHLLTLDSEGGPADWQAATALPPHKVQANGFGSYLAPNYDALVDAPVELGNFWSGSFEAGGIEHRFVVAGAAPSFDAARLLADTQAICAAEIAFWHEDSYNNNSYSRNEHKGQRPISHKNYLFMLNAVDKGYGGLEHKNSTALICKRADLPRIDQAKALSPTDGYTTLLGLISHEYFHTWNVKRLRPAEFGRYDYAQENYTELLWFFEGFTSYYDDLLLRRAGLIDDASYLSLLAKTINQVLQTPGRKLQSVAQASFDAWVKYYRQDENTANATISYYTKGSLVALCLDLTLRQGGQTSLDAVMRALWLRCQGGPMTQDDLLTVLQELSGCSFQTEIDQWVHGTADLPLKTLLQQHGVACQEAPAALAEQLGLRVTEQNGVRVKSVLRGSAAELAGFAADDEWLGVEVAQGRGKHKTVQAWRLAKLDELPLYVAKHQNFKALIARDARLQTLVVTLSDTATNVKLTISDAKRVSQWLANA